MKEAHSQFGYLLGRITPIALVWAAGSAATALAAEPADPAQRVDPKEARLKALTPAEIDDALAIGGTEIDGDKIVSRMTVQVKINDRGPYRFVVDSGADTSVVGERIARELNLPAGRRAILASVTDTQYVDRVLVDRFELGPTIMDDLEIPVLRERDLGAEGMIGLDALVEQRVMLDFDKRLITVDDGRTPAKRYDDEIVVTARLRKGQLILTKVSAEGQRLNAIVDTGSQITIGNRALLEKLMKRHADQFTEVEAIGVTGTAIKLQVARVGVLRIGGIRLQNIAIAFADIPPFEAFGLKSEPSLLLGTDLLEHFRRVSLDFHDRKVRFQLRRCQPTGVILRNSAYASRISSETPAECAR